MPDYMHVNLHHWKFLGYTPSSFPLPGAPIAVGRMIIAERKTVKIPYLWPPASCMAIPAKIMR